MAGDGLVCAQGRAFIPGGRSLFIAAWLWGWRSLGALSGESQLINSEGGGKRQQWDAGGERLLQQKSEVRWERLEGFGLVAACSKNDPGLGRALAFTCNFPRFHELNTNPQDIGILTLFQRAAWARHTRFDSAFCDSSPVHVTDRNGIHPV